MKRGPGQDASGLESACCPQPEWLALHLRPLECGPELPQTHLQARFPSLGENPRVGHRVLFRSERSILFRSFKERNDLFRSFF